MTNVERLTTMTESESEQIEELLREWYRWQIRQSHAITLSHYFRTGDLTCQGYVTPTSMEDEEDPYRTADDAQSEQVQLCVSELTVEQRAAISTSMRNKECGATVWSTIRARAWHATYLAAKDALLPMFVRRRLLLLNERTA
ncbi:hypothetical protein QZM99_06020 [Burkholderia gladioli]|uniref:hypothetical protein n=1 Tax=Burkholderia gladioli TaxID=28095 RepID=UPI00163FEF8D|nr:hypothetical protein [Burkholderia gladioli]MDN7917644.1 hypothetical protein [Burkholderia gladioli]